MSTTEFDTDFVSKPIGTAMTGNATTVLLLGAGELGKELTASFQRLGLEVHAVDKYLNAPAHQLAQYAYVADITDPAQVRGLIQRVRPDYVVPEVETVATEVLAEADEAGTVVVPTAHACELANGREKIRVKAAEELGLPTTAYSFVTTVEEYHEAFEELGFPCIVKPSASASTGRRHVVVNSEDEVDNAWRVVNRGRVEPAGEQSVVVERFVDFDCEITILAVRSIDPATGELATWFCEPIGHAHSKGDLVESWQPVALSETAMDNARSVAARITNELGGRGVYGVDLFVSGDDVYFSTVSPRPHESGMVTLASQRFSEFDLHVRAILGLPIDVTMTTPGAVRMLSAPRAFREVSYSGIASALEVPESQIRLFGKPTAYPGRRMGMAVATAETAEEARTRATEAARRVSID